MLSFLVYQEVLCLKKKFSLDNEVFVTVVEAVQTGEKTLDLGTKTLRF